MYLTGFGHMGFFNDYAQRFWSQFGNVTSTYGSLCMIPGKTGVKYTYGDTIKNNNN
jgi:anaerobic selenocysteine-containing dehydrogenase